MSYAPNAVKFDGANDYLTRGGDLTGVADSKSGIFSCWVRWDGLDGVNSSILSIPYVSSGAFNVYKTANVVTFEAYDAATTAALNMRTSKQLASVKWYHILASWDLATGATHLYVSDVSDKAVTTAANLTIDLTTGNCLIGATTSGAQKFDGAIGELYFAPGQYLDFSVAANRRKFIDASGLPVYLGANGSTPTGTAPAIYLNGNKASFGTNSGSGGNFTVNGALETASTTPATVPAWNAVSFAEGTDYLLLNGDLAGVSDGNTGLISFWFRLDADYSGAAKYLLLENNFSRWFVVIDSVANAIRLAFRNSAGTYLVDMKTSVTLLTKGGGTWYHVLASWDLSTLTTHLYINGVSDKTVTTAVAGSIDYTGGLATRIMGQPAASLCEFYFAPNQYLDLSVQANREKFILNGAPVTLGADGSTPTGTAPAIYLPNRAALVGANAGSGGTFTVNGAPKDANSTPTYYYAEPVKFDGSTGYLVRGAELTGMSDGKAGTFSAWLRLDGGDGTSMRILGNLSSALHFLVYRVSTNKFMIFGQNASAGTILVMTTVNSYTASSGWLHLLASWNLATGACALYINNASDLAAGPTLINDTIDYANGNWSVAAYTDGTGKFNGAIADLWFNTSYLDLSVQANRTKFIDQATLRPVPLGAKGEKPTGAQPLLYLGRDAANFGKNLGSGGDFS